MRCEQIFESWFSEPWNHGGPGWFKGGKKGGQPFKTRPSKIHRGSYNFSPACKPPARFASPESTFPKAALGPIIGPCKTHSRSYIPPPPCSWLKAPKGPPHLPVIRRVVFLCKVRIHACIHSQNELSLDEQMPRRSVVVFLWLCFRFDHNVTPVYTTQLRSYEFTSSNQY